MRQRLIVMTALFALAWTHRRPPRPARSPRSPPNIPSY